LRARPQSTAQTQRNVVRQATESDARGDDEADLLHSWALCQADAMPRENAGKNGCILDFLHGEDIGPDAAGDTPQGCKVAAAACQPEGDVTG
jgi:hypothetical protein